MCGARCHVNGFAGEVLELEDAHVSELDETQAIAQVGDRLVERFPSLGRDRITAVVNDEHGQLHDGRVRQFIPVFVEKAAKKQLKKEAKAIGAVLEQSEALAPLPDSDPGPSPLELTAKPARARVDPFWAIFLEVPPEQIAD